MTNKTKTEKKEKDMSNSEDLILFDPISESHIGRLMEIQESDETGFLFNIWFDYTRELYNQINIGSFLAIKNFTISERDDENVYSILKIIKKLPTHYAMIQNLNKGYPSFSEEAARGIRSSFIDQHDTSEEDLTKILVTAIPTRWEFVYNDNIKKLSDFKTRPETNIPIYGEEAKILSSQAVQKIVNANLELNQRGIVPIGTIKDDPKVNVLLDVENCLKTHFGIFGFTGVGKSNLMSTFISKIFSKEDSIKKVLFFDLMDEYFGLLIDLFVKKNLNAYLVYLDYNDLNEKQIKYFETKEYDEDMADILYNQMVLPKDIKFGNVYKDSIKEIIKFLYSTNKIKVINNEKSCIEWINENFESLVVSIQDKQKFINEIVQYIFKKGVNLNDLVTENLKQNIVKIIESAEPPSKQNLKKSNSHSQSTLDKSFQNNKQGININEPTLPEEFNRPAWKTLKSNLSRQLKKDKIIDYSKLKDFSISIEQIINEVQRNDISSLFIFISSKDETIRTFLNRIGNALYDHRKQNGLIEPVTSLIFDESDSFIPQNDNNNPTIKDSKIIIEQYARRGRKFGLGIGLATQRVTFLDTTILGQMHTYFVSKLPRKSDRDRIQEAFSLSEEELKETFKYTKGNWLLVSHEGTGLEGVALSIKSENANTRIIDFLKVFKENLKV